jgi:hypothetical protein
LLTIISLRKRNPKLECQQNQFAGKRDITDARSAWCSIELNSSAITTRVNHISAGKFIIVEDKEDGKYVGIIVDASEIIHCA